MRTALSIGSLVLAVAGLAVAADPALAAWSGSGAGSAAGAATIMPGGQAPSGNATGASVTVQWPAATFPNGAPVAGYIVRRYDFATGAQATVGPGCSGTVTSTSCTETAVPAGTWVYTDTPVQDSWTGTESSASPAVSVTG